MLEGSSPRALVVTVVHHPDDARIRHRQITALLDHGWRVTYAAPFSGHGVDPRPTAGLRTIDLPRAVGRRRLAALRRARRVLRAEAPGHDVVVLHDPELLLVAGRSARAVTPVVWDVHEDTAAALGTKAWLPGPLRRPAVVGVRALERSAERNVHLLLAESAYRDRFRGAHPVVPNSALVPASVSPPDRPRAVYVGHHSRARGLVELLEVARLLRRDGITVELIGHADAESTRLLDRALADGDVRWHGFLPLGEAAARLEGSYAGLSLLHDLPNYRHSRPSKVIDYLARGVPVVTTPLPQARALVEESGGGLVVPFGDPVAVATAVRRLAADGSLRARLGAAGHAHARAHLDWHRDSVAFVAALERVAGGDAALSGSSARTRVPRRRA